MPSPLLKNSSPRFHGEFLVIIQVHVSPIERGFSQTSLSYLYSTPNYISLLYFLYNIIYLPYFFVVLTCLLV